jgi:hypothetical protein
MEKIQYFSDFFPYFDNFIFKKSLDLEKKLNKFTTMKKKTHTRIKGRHPQCGPLPISTTCTIT